MRSFASSSASGPPQAVIDLNRSEHVSATRNPCYTDPVANLTLAIDDDLLRRARIRALEQGTSVNAVVRDYLAAYVDTDSPLRAARRFLSIADEHPETGTAGTGRTWTRNDIYGERFDG